MDHSPADGLPSRLRSRLASASDIEGSLLAMGAVTGLLTGLLAAVLILAIRWVQPLLWGVDTVASWQLLVVPTAGAFVVGLLVTYVVPESSGSGIVRTMETLAVRGGRFRRRVPTAGLATTVVALASGASGGREGPIGLMGGATGSLIAQLFRQDEARTRAMVAAGVAAGIGASFNAPIGGMLFAIELILGRFQARSLQVVVVASVVGSVTAREIVGSGVTFDIGTSYTFSEPTELLGYLVLGVAAAGLGVAFIRGEALAYRLFTGLRRHLWRPLVLAIAGLGVGTIALVVPEVLGTGDDLPPIDGFVDPIHTFLTVDFGVGWAALGTLGLLLVGKFAATMLSIGSGSAIGTFAPTMFTGGALGAMVGTGLAMVAPASTPQPAAFALVGMAAGFSAAARAPLTSILIVFELTGDYGMVLPLMLSCGIATWLAERAESDSVYMHPLTERGITYGQLDDIDVLQTVTVGEAMTPDHPTLRAEQGYESIAAQFRTTGSHGFAVVDGGGRLVGILTRSDFEAASRHPQVTSGRREVSSLIATDIATPRPSVVNPEEAIHTAVHRMAAMGVGRVPVIERHSKRLVGMVRRSDVVTAYQLGLNRHLGHQQHDASDELRDLAGVKFLDVAVGRDALAAGREIREVEWPSRTIVTSIRRGAEVVMPTGDTVLRPGDGVVLLADPTAHDTLRHLLSAPAAAGLDRTDPAQRDHLKDSKEPG